MNQIETGKFIKTARKEKSLTQRELAEKLNISEKTVSKWETGNGLPEVSLMLPLCKILDITVNELLSGERLNEQRYLEKAEENIVSLCDRTSPRKKIVISTVSCIFVIMCCVALIFIAALFPLPLWVRLLIIGITLILVASDIAVILLVAVSTEIFACDKCGEKFVPTLSAYVLGIHTLHRRRLKCPHCGKKSWCKGTFRK